MSNTIRTFIAIPLTPEIRNMITPIQDRLKKLDCNISWVKPENIHLTLKFLGDVKMKKIDTIKQVLENLFQSTRPIPMKLSKIGAFPDINHPRILWVGLNDGGRQITHLVSLIEDECGKIGFKKEEKPFNPHITIGRIRSPKNLHLLAEAISNFAIPDHLTQLSQTIILYQSTLTSQGPVYEILKDFSFCNI
ncbi:MAG TPA: RNA 2',3'-cyclic phosphodiesterase [Chitinophagaceae bacterium]|nr:RNA 2',3'-cyclic phosphodiesterase [Chitinophagaceae bacterium]